MESVVKGLIVHNNVWTVFIESAMYWFMYTMGESICVIIVLFIFVIELLLSTLCIHLCVFMQTRKVFKAILLSNILRVVN